MKARLISVLLVIALLVTVGVITAQAEEPTYYLSETALERFNGASSTGLSFTGTGSQTGICPICGTEQTWTELTKDLASGTALTEGHYYLSSDLTGESALENYFLLSYDKNNENLNGWTVNFGDGKNTALPYTHCIFLNGHDITSSTYVFKTSGSTGQGINIFGSGKVTTTGNTPVIEYNCRNLNILGGTYSSKGTVAIRADSAAKGTKILTIGGTTVVNDTVEIRQSSFALIGGEMDKVVIPARASGNTFTGRPMKLVNYNGIPEIGGNVVIKELVLETYKPTVAMLQDGASITVNSTGSAFQITNALYDYASSANIKTQEVADAVAKYFHAYNPEAYDIIAQKASTGNFTIYSKQKADVVNCEICGKETVWQDLSAAPEGNTLAMGHYQLTGDLDLTSALKVAENVCINLCGHNINSTGRVLEQTAGTLNIFGSGTVTGAGADETAATIQLTAGTLNLKGGTYKHTGTKPTVHMTTGTLTMEAGAILTADAGVTGSNLYINNGTFTMNGGEISNGKAAEGGNIYQYNGKIYIKGGEIKDGIATNAEAGGGNIYCRVGGMYLSGGKITGGMAAPTDNEDETVTYMGKGGNIRIQYQAINASEIAGTVEISGGKARDGGNIYHNGGDKKLSIAGSAKIVDGFAERYGGNIVLAPSVNAPSNPTTTCDSVTITGGQAAYGGNIFVEANTAKEGAPRVVDLSLVGGTFGGGSAINGAFLFQVGGNVNICNGTFNAGDASSKGDLLYLRGGNMLLSGGNMNLGESGDYVVYVGQSDSYTPKLILGKTTITSAGWLNPLVLDAKALESTVYVNNALAALEVLSSFENTAALNLIAAETNPVIPASDYYGAKVENATAEAFTGKLFLTKGDKPEILKDGNGGLVVAGAQKDGVWTTTADAFANADNNIKLYENNAEVTINKNTALVDLNGNNITVNGSGAFNAYNSNSAKAAEVTLGVGVTTGIDGFAISEWKTTAGKLGGYYEIAIKGENNKVSYHKLEMAMTSISLRPNEAGLYYTSKVVADDSLKGLISDAGILLGTIDSNERNESAVKSNMAGIKGKNTEAAAVYAQEMGFSIVAPNNKVWTDITSVMIKDILQENDADWNGTYGQWPVIGTPFVVIADKYLPAGQEETKAYSMKGYLELAADAVVAGKITTQAEALADFCDKYDVYNLGWGITADSWIVPAPAPAPEEE